MTVAYSCTFGANKLSKCCFIASEDADSNDNFTVTLLRATPELDAAACVASVVSASRRQRVGKSLGSVVKLVLVS